MVSPRAYRATKVGKRAYMSMCSTGIIVYRNTQHYAVYDLVLKLRALTSPRVDTPLVSHMLLKFLWIVPIPPPPPTPHNCESVLPEYTPHDLLSLVVLFFCATLVLSIMSLFIECLLLRPLCKSLSLSLPNLHDLFQVLSPSRGWRYSTHL